MIVFELFAWSWVLYLAGVLLLFAFFYALIANWIGDWRPRVVLRVLWGKDGR